MTTTFRSSGICTDTTLPFAERDTFLVGAIGAHLFDLASSYSYSLAAAPANATPVKDLARDSADAAVKLGAGQTIQYAGGGFDFSQITAKPNGVFFPASAINSIWGDDGGATAIATISGGAVTGITITNGGSGYSGQVSAALVGGGGSGARAIVDVVDGVVTGATVQIAGSGYTSEPTVVFSGRSPQYFLAGGYIKLPETDDWNASATQFTFMSACEVSSGPNISNPDLVTVAFVGVSGVPSIRATRYANGTPQTVTLAIPEKHHGRLAQVAFWRDETGNYLRTKTSQGEEVGSVTVGYANAIDFRGKNLGFGVLVPYSSFSGDSANAMKYRIYRGFIEDLAVSGRDALTSLDGDWERIVARGAFL